MAVGACFPVGQGLIEVEVRDRLRIRGIESSGLIETELGLGWGAGGTEGRRPTGKIDSKRREAKVANLSTLSVALACPTHPRLRKLV